MAFNILSVA